MGDRVFGKRNGQHGLYGHYGHYRRIISKLMKSIDTIEEMFLRDNQGYLTKKAERENLPARANSILSTRTNKDCYAVNIWQGKPAAEGILK